MSKCFRARVAHEPPPVVERETRASTTVGPSERGIDEIAAFKRPMIHRGVSIRPSGQQNLTVGN